MIQFALGIALAHVRKANPQDLCHLIGGKALFLGAGLLICSWALRTYVPLGKAFNDPLTSIGVFLLLLNLSWKIRNLPRISTVLASLSYKSYFMFLIHYPVMQFLIGPPLRVPTNPLIVVVFGGLYTLLIFFICFFISNPINRLTSWMYKKYPAQLEERLPYPNF
jgi:peptidoglycan/LPS O-acetylase OafA/YrhL